MKRRAFSLAEALITATLVCVVLGVVGLVMRNWAAGLGFLERKDRTLQAAAAMLTVTAELRQAVELVATGPELIFRKPVPGPPDPPPGRVQVRYSCDRGQLLRELEGHPAEALAEVDGLACRQLADGTLELRVVTGDRTLAYLVRCPVLAP